jgi:hypothetical protein
VTQPRASGGPGAGERLAGDSTPLPKAGKTFWVLGSLISLKACTSNYTLLEVTAFPGSSPPPFVHHAQEALMCVLEGEFAISGESLPTGSCALIPKDAFRTVAVAGSKPGRCLVILTPPGPAEGFFEEVGIPVADGDHPTPPEGAPDVEATLEIARRHGIELLMTPV